MPFNFLFNRHNQVKKNENQNISPLDSVPQQNQVGASAPINPVQTGPGPGPGPVTNQVQTGFAGMFPNRRGSIASASAAARRSSIASVSERRESVASQNSYHKSSDNLLVGL